MFSYIFSLIYEFSESIIFRGKIVNMIGHNVRNPFSSIGRFVG